MSAYQTQLFVKEQILSVVPQAISGLGGSGHVVNDLSEAVGGRVVKVRNRQADRERLEQLTQGKDLGGVVRVQASDEDAAVRLRDDQSFLFEAPEGLAHGSPAQA